MNLHLSRLLLNPRSRQVRSDMAKPYEMHRTLMRAFPSAEEGGPGRVLFRVEEDPRHGFATLLVQSEKKPDWEYLRDLDDYLAESDEDNPAVKEFSPEIHSGHTLRFRLRANPTRRRSSDGRRLGIFKEEDQLEWLSRKGQQGGFRILDGRVLPKGLREQGTSGGGEKKSHITMYTALFEGVLEVTDPEAFTTALASGIGSGKGLGFGLLSVGKA